MINLASMRSWLRLVLLTVPLCAAASAAPPDDPAASSAIDKAIQLYDNGEPGQALRALELVLGEHPDNLRALYSDGAIQAELGHADLARKRFEHLVELNPGAFHAWEHLVQLYQDAGALQERDNAISYIHRIYLSTRNPAIANLSYFVRENLVNKGRVYVVRDVLDPGNGTILRYVIVPIAELSHPRHIIVLRSDEDLNQLWREQGKLTGVARLYTLDRLNLENKDDPRRETYAFYMDEPSYDAIRPTVIAILDGTAKPLSAGSDKVPVVSFPPPRIVSSTP
jgi:tetratricopeptide (TPR) repeat protein